jgi:hypothetical protein
MALPILIVGTIAGAGAPAAAEERVVCTAQKVQDQDYQGLPDPYRARVICSSIPRNKKIRAKLDVQWDTDQHSAWFTNTNVWYYTGNNLCTFGCSATLEVANR